MIKPEISVGLPVYNGERYLKLAIESVLKQGYENFELIISDNASTDHSQEICFEYMRIDKRVKYFRNDFNIGSAPNYEKLVFLAEGTYFKWLAHDDLLKEGFLSKTLKAFRNADPTTVLVYPICELIDGDGASLGTVTEHIESQSEKPHIRIAQVIKKISNGTPLNGLIVTSVLKKTKLSCSESYWDIALLAELALWGKILEIQEILMQQRSYEGNALAICSEVNGKIVTNTPKKANRRTRRALLVWENPQNESKIMMLPSSEEQCWQILKRVNSVPLRKKDKLRCIVTVFIEWYIARAKAFGGTLKRRFMQAGE